MQDFMNTLISYLASLFGQHNRGRKSPAYSRIYIHNAELHRLYRRDLDDR